MQKYTNTFNGLVYSVNEEGRYMVERDGVAVESTMDDETFVSMIRDGVMVAIPSLDEMLRTIDQLDTTTYQWLLTCGATHLAVDKDGGIYGYRQRPTIDEVFMGGTWRGPCCIWCGDMEYREDWRTLVWELP